MELTGGAKRRLQKITPPGYEARIDLTITDEGPMAHAFVVISAIPARRLTVAGGDGSRAGRARDENFVMCPACCRKPLEFPCKTAADRTPRRIPRAIALWACQEATRSRAGA